MANENVSVNNSAAVKPSAPSAPVPKDLKKVRVVSLDVLRGFDMFLLCGFASIFGRLMTGPLNDWFGANETWKKISDLLVYQVCEHSNWTGFTLHDLIMPLFMFMAGVTISFSMAKYRKSESNPDPSRTKFALRLTRRIFLLWIFGMMVQGNLLNLQWNGLRLYSNTLQAIAAGYLIAVTCYFLMGKIGQTITAIVLMLVFWGVMTWVPAKDLAGETVRGLFEPGANVAEWIDRLVLGRWMDGVKFNEDGSFLFSEHYHYTWILSSLTFGATTIAGLIAGEFIKARAALAGKSRHITSLILIGIGALSAAIGWGWGMVPQGYFGYCPLVKHLWTPSMVLYAAGLSYLLLGLSYEIYDVLHLPLCKTFFIVIGMNAILAYLIRSFWGNFSGDVSVLIHGLEHHIGNWYELLLKTLSFAVLWFILWVAYKKKLFIRL